MTVAATPGPSTWIGPFAVTLGTQTVVAMLTRITPTLAPVLVAQASVTPSFIGWLATVGTLGSILFYFCGMPLIRRVGSVRVMQIGMLAAALGTALLVFPVASVLIIGSMLIGFGYAPSTPAGSDLLQRYAPKRHRTLIFSVKQAGVPLGGMLAGVLLPPLVQIDWRLAILLCAALVLIVAAAVQPLRPQLDQDRDRKQDLSLGTLLAPSNMLLPVTALRLSPRIPPIAISGLCLAAAQGATFAFLVTFLVMRLGYDLTLAGTLFAVVQVSGVFGRIVLGGLADRLGSAVVTMSVTAITSALTTAVYAFAGPDWPLWSIALVSAVTGITISSWNGLMLAEIAAAVPLERVAEATAGTTLMVFLGYVIGPAVFALILDGTDSYRLAFLSLSVLTVIGALVLLAARRGASSAKPS